MSRIQSFSEKWFWGIAILLVSVAAMVALVLVPAMPNLPASDYQLADQSEYSPGSPQCMPSRLAKLEDKAALDVRYLCDLQAEREREHGQDLVQQTRSANAAEALTSLTYHQTRMIVVGTVFGVLTLLAAGAAAFYAKAAADAGRHANDIAREGNRPWLQVRFPTALHYRPQKENGAHIFSTFIDAKNFGTVPAVTVSVRMTFLHGSVLALEKEISRFINEKVPKSPFGISIYPNEDAVLTREHQYNLNLDETISMETIEGKEYLCNVYYFGIAVFYNSPMSPYTYYSVKIFQIYLFNRPEYLTELPEESVSFELHSIGGEHHGRLLVSKSHPTQ